MLCLDGVSRQDLNNCLDYMYNGEIQIYQDDLDRFLDIAQRFQIKGLLNNEVGADEETQAMDDQANQESNTANIQTERHSDDSIITKNSNRLPYWLELTSYCLTVLFE